MPLVFVSYQDENWLPFRLNYFRTLTENQGSLFRAMETPEPPSKGFFSSLFSSAASPLDREQLCKCSFSQSYPFLNPVAKFIQEIIYPKLSQSVRQSIRQKQYCIFPIHVIWRYSWVANHANNERIFFFSDWTWRLVSKKWGLLTGSIEDLKKSSVTKEKFNGPLFSF